MTDAHLAALFLLFDKHIYKAASIVDAGGVTSVISRDSARVVYRVTSSSKSSEGGVIEGYTVFPEHYCSCHSFFYDVVSKGEGVYCKHQLAAWLSDALGRTKKRVVEDLVVSEILEQV